MRYGLQVILLAFLSLLAPSAMAHELPEPAGAGSPPPQQADDPGAENQPGEQLIPREWFANINLAVGSQQMLDSGWKDNPAQRLDAVEFSADLGKLDWPVSLYIGGVSGTRSSSQSRRGYDYSISTFVIGPRLYLNKTGPVRPYLSGGLAVISADRKPDWSSRTENLDSARGVFANAGVIFKLGRYFHMGLNLLATLGGGLDGKSNSDHVTAGLIFGFGSE